MNAKALLKNALRSFASERVLSEVAVEARVLLLTRLPNVAFPSRWLQARRARQLRGIKLNLGCGPLLDPGWVGVDYRAENTIRCDIKRRLPFSAGACRYIFSEHVFEHFDLGELDSVLRECHRVLEPDGVLRIVTPDLDKFLAACYREDESFGQTVFGRPLSPAQTLNEVFCLVTHRFIHNYSTLKTALLSAGFSDVQQSSYRGSGRPELNIDCGLLSRTICSLYVEATK